MVAVANFSVPIAYLREIGVVPEVSSQSDPVTQILERSRRYLVTERGLVLRVPVPAVSVVGAIFLFGVVGWVYPDLEVRSQARATRKAWSQVITVFVDVVGISLAGGAGVEDALMVAAQAGNGPQFEELAAAMRAAQTRRRKLWYALDDLGVRCDIVALRELAAAVELAAESGSRIRETLVAKAEAMRVRKPVR